jgi:hypothetical protein
VIATPGQLWAIAKMTLLEALRRKVFAVLILFAAVLLSSVAFFPSVDMLGRLRLIEIWSLRAAAVFTAIVALFLAGFSLPGDFEQKRIYLLVTKPVSKGAVFAGRFLGFALLLALFVGTLGAVTALFIRGVQLTAGKDFPPLVAHPRRLAAEFSHRGGGVDPDKPERLVAFGENGGGLVWTFHDVRPSDFPDRLRVAATLVLESPTDPYRAAGTLRVAVTRGSGRREEIQLSANTNEEREFTLPAEILQGDGALELEVVPLDKDGMAGATRESVVLFERPMNFELNFARGLFLVFLQSLIVLAVTLASSTTVSAPVAILLGILIYLVGSSHGFVREGTRDIEQSLQQIKPDGPSRRTPEDLPAPVLWVSSRLSKAVLAVVPDFDHFDFSRWLLKDRAVSWKELAGAGRRALPPVLLLGIVGTMVMIFKDYG